MNKRDLQILKIALPAIATNVTVPLLGLVDTAIVGHMGSAAYIGAIAVGSMMFNLVYWLLGFLRMSTSGLTAQARGRRDFGEATRQLMKSVEFSLLLSVGLLVFQSELYRLLMWAIAPTPDVAPLAEVYYRICIWGAPAVLPVLAMGGWFIGMQNTRTILFVSVIQNVVNIALSLYFVYGMGAKLEGVAMGTVVAQYLGFFICAFCLWKYYWRHLVFPKGRTAGGQVKRGMVRVRSGSRKILHQPSLAWENVSLDIFLRTVCLVAVNLYFTAAGARQGAEILAVNTLLMQLYLLFSFVMDGFAFAGEALGGRFWGAGERKSYQSVVRHLFLWGALMTALFTCVYITGGMDFLRMLTDHRDVVFASEGYVWWAYLIPVAGAAAFIWDGLFIGTTQTRGMLLSSAIAAAVFFCTAHWGMPWIGNQALWLAMILFLALRGIVQTIIAPKMK